MKELSSQELQAKLVPLIEQFHGDTVSKPPRATYTSTAHQQLTERQVNDAIVLMSRYLGMVGSSGDCDMYRLNQAYLLDPRMRATMNMLVEGWRPGEGGSA
jgi:hypothetical protein